MLVGSIQQAAPRGGQHGIVPEIDFKTLVCIYILVCTLWVLKLSM